MKYTIHGFNQQKSIELGLDHDDLLILRYIVDFKDSGEMATEIIDGECFYWVKYEGILRALPILKLKKDTVYRRLKDMCKVGILKHKTIKRAGTYSFYTIGNKYIELISSVSEFNPRGTDLNPGGYGNKSVEGTDLNPEQKIHLLKDSSIKNSSSHSSKELTNKDVYTHYEQCGFGLLNATLIEMLDADVQVFGKEWVIDAMKEAVRQNRYKLTYVEGILRNWKADGRKPPKEEAFKNGGTKGNKRNNKQGGTSGPSEETQRLEEYARQQGINIDNIQDFECEF